MAQFYASFSKAEWVLQLTYGLYFAGYASITVAFLLGILTLASPGDRKYETGSFLTRAMGSTHMNSEKLNRQWNRFGFLLLACGLILGVFWAKFTRGDTWALDPKENLGLVSCLIYGAVLHLHFTPVFKGRKAVWASVFAWVCILFIYFGMSRLPTKNHSMYPDSGHSGAGERGP